MADKFTHICLAGYGWSGSGAVLDLLNEFDGFGGSELEIRIFKDTHGVMDLEHALIEKWDALNVDLAIRDFWKFAEEINPNPSRFRRGLMYDHEFNGKFLEITEQFVQDITKYRYKSYWWMYDFRMSWCKLIARKIRNKISPKLYFENMYFSDISKEEFYKAVKKYSEALAEATVKGKECNYIVWDQAIPPQHPDKTFDYFNNSKIIIVDRDPRDIYVELVELKKFVGMDIAETHAVEKYIKMHKKYRERVCEDNEKVLRIAFEDLIFNYEESVQTIMRFIGAENLPHIRKRELFNPDVSIKNIGKYKTYPHQDEIKIIEQELGDYLYHNA